MKRTSLVSTMLALSIVLSIPTIVFGRSNSTDFTLPNNTDTLTLNHRGQPHHGGHGGHGGCW